MTAEDLSQATRSRAFLQHDEPMQRPAYSLPQPKVRQTQINVALQLLQNGDQVILLSGAEGMDKAGFLQSLAQQQPDSLQVHIATAAPGMDAAALLAGFAEGLPASADAYEILNAASRSGGRPTLLVDDDAALLPHETLADLLALWLRAHAEALPFSLLLSGKPGFERRLEQLGALQPSQLHRINLQAFTADQTLEYIELRLTGAETLLDANRLRAIHKRARGVPAAIDHELDKLLNGSGGGRKMRSSQSLLRLVAERRSSLLVVAALLALAIVLLVALRYAEQQETPPPASRVEQLDPVPDLFAQPLEQQPFDEPLPHESMLADESTSATPLELPEQPEPMHPEELLATPDVEEPAAAASQEAPVEEAMPIERLATPQPAPADPEPAEPKAETPPAGDAAPGHTDAVASTALRGNAWLHQQNPSRFTIQLIAASDAAALANFIRHQKLEDRAALLTVERNQSDWHVVVVGDYPNRAAGRAALRELPQVLRKDGAWIRSFGELQQSARD